MKKKNPRKSFTMHSGRKFRKAGQNMKEFFNLLFTNLTFIFRKTKWSLQKARTSLSKNNTNFMKIGI